jgi:LEA14-like dessication related protein
MSLTVNVNATNPNSTNAEIEGLEWALDLENKTLFTGNVANRVSIPANGGKTLIPLSFQFDIMDVLKGESKDNILSFVQGVLDVGNASSKVSFKIKPSVMVGGQKISAPGFITLSKTVGN